MYAHCAPHLIYPVYLTIHNTNLMEFDSKYGMYTINPKTKETKKKKKSVLRQFGELFRLIELSFHFPS